MNFNKSHIDVVRGGHHNNQCSVFREEEKRNKFSERGWSRLVEAIRQRNSTEGMREPTRTC
jgi:hypothetical protein